MPSIIDVPRKCPDDVKGELKSSFSLFFMDANAAANHVRVALERLMDHFGVQCRQKDKTKKFVDLSLHRRIEIFAKKQTAVGAPLMALKWLGNAAVMVELSVKMTFWMRMRFSNTLLSNL